MQREGEFTYLNAPLCNNKTVCTYGEKLVNRIQVLLKKISLVHQVYLQGFSLFKKRTPSLDTFPCSTMFKFSVPFRCFGGFFVEQEGSLLPNCLYKHITHSVILIGPSLFIQKTFKGRLVQTGRGHPIFCPSAISFFLSLKDPYPSSPSLTLSHPPTDQSLSATIFSVFIYFIYNCLSSQRGPKVAYIIRCHFTLTTTLCGILH